MLLEGLLLELLVVVAVVLLVFIIEIDGFVLMLEDSPPGNNIDVSLLIRFGFDLLAWILELAFKLLPAAAAAVDDELT